MSIKNRTGSTLDEFLATKGELDDVQAIARGRGVIIEEKSEEVSIGIEESYIEYRGAEKEMVFVGRWRQKDVEAALSFHKKAASTSAKQRLRDRK